MHSSAAPLAWSIQETARAMIKIAGKKAEFVLAFVSPLMLICSPPYNGNSRPRSLPLSNFAAAKMQVRYSIKHLEVYILT